MTIPKIIHYCWLSGDPFSELAQKCIASWHKAMPDYTYILWDRERVKEISNKWIDGAINAKKWAFAADYIRLYSLCKYGGIYLDCDVEVLKPFDNLLNQECFLGREGHKNVVEAAVMGSSPNQDWTKKALDWYSDRNFDVTQLNNPSIAVPFILKKILNDYPNIRLLPAEYFSPKDNRTGERNITSNTYAIHHFDGNWHSDYQREYFRIRVEYSKKLGSLVGLIIATLFSIKHKLER